jgi:hypothetical protein
MIYYMQQVFSFLFLIIIVCSCLHLSAHTLPDSVSRIAMFIAELPKVIKGEFNQDNDMHFETVATFSSVVLTDNDCLVRN